MEVLARYKRKAVPTPLEIRGISQNADVLVQPSPDELPPMGSLPRDFTDHVQEAISSYSPEPVKNVRVRAVMASQPSAVPEETRSLSLSDTWTTGVGAGSSTERMTDDRSSTSSAMSYDDFDHEASVKVRRMFEEIDAVLFESTEPMPAGDDSGGHRAGDTSDHHIRTECGQWSAVFPHLRILGKQLLETKDMGYQSLSSPLSSTSTSFMLPSDAGSPGSHLEDVTDQDLHDAHSLSVEGRRITPKTLDKCCPPGYGFETVRHLEEEIFMQDGSYEEIIAIDNDAQDETMDSRKLHAVQRRRRSRYPPVTPNACVKDDVCNAVFDVIWASANGAMRVLLQQYADSFVVPSLQHRSHYGGGAGARGRDGAGKALGGGPANDGAFRFPQIVSQPPSRADFAHPSNRPLGSLFAASGNVVRHPHLPGSNASATPGSSHTPSATAPALETIKLDNILTISKKEMQAREKTFSEEPSSSGTPTASMSWPGGSLLKKAPAAAMAGILHRNTSATVKKATAGRGRLAPLNDRVRTPTVEDDVSRTTGGHGLQGLHMAGKRISSPPMAAASSGMRALPPIMQSEQFDGAAATSLSQRMQKRGSRATSAIAEKDGRTPRDRMTYARDMPETRPSTTHTAFRADTPNNNNLASSNNRQSSTPIGIATHFKGDGANVLLGITGSSLAGGSGSVQPRDVVAAAAGESSLLPAAALAEQLRQRAAYDDADLDDDDVDNEHYDDFSRQHIHHGHHQQHWGSTHATSGYGAASAAAGYRLRGGKTVSSLAR